MLTRLRQLSNYGVATLVVALSTVVAAAAEPYSQLGDLAVVHLLAVVLLSTKFSLRVSVFACVLSILAFDFIFIPPRFAFAWTDAKSGLTFVAMIVVACVISGLTERLRREEHVARAAASRTEALFQLHVDLSTASDARQLAAITSRHLERLLSAKVSILLGTPETWHSEDLPAHELALAERAWSRRELKADDTARGGSIWAPLIGLNTDFGVIGVLASAARSNDANETFLVTACANQFVSALERVRLANAVHRSELEAEAERLRNSLLSAVSHDLKTPLTTIIAAGAALLSDPGAGSVTQKHLLSSIIGEGERLHHLIDNLLSVARLESPSIRLRRTTESIEEIVSATVARFRASHARARITLHSQPTLPFLFAEPVLVGQVLVNLLENAHRYGGPDVNLELHITSAQSFICVRVVDDGPGIPEDERDKVFEKFYRGRAGGKSDGGVGLGLTICRAIIKAHGGRIAVQARDGGGTVVEFTLPAADASVIGTVVDQDKLAS